MTDPRDLVLADFTRIPCEHPDYWELRTYREAGYVLVSCTECDLSWSQPIETKDSA